MPTGSCWASASTFNADANTTMKSRFDRRKPKAGPRARICGFNSDTIGNMDTGRSKPETSPGRHPRGRTFPVRGETGKSAGGEWRMRGGEPLRPVTRRLPHCLGLLLLLALGAGCRVVQTATDVPGEA